MLCRLPPCCFLGVQYVGLRATRAAVSLSYIGTARNIIQVSSCCVHMWSLFNAGTYVPGRGTGIRAGTGYIPHPTTLSTG